MPPEPRPDPRSGPAAARRFRYYERLSPWARRVYDRSDAIPEVELARPDLLRPFVAALEESLEARDRQGVEAAAAGVVSGLARMLDVPEARVDVLAVRPHSRWGELHGLYTTADRSRPARIQVWMRTAHHRRIVVFKTFLRTLLHEAGHHLDYVHLRLPESFHTLGFFRRESSLFRQLVGGPEAGTSPNRERA